MPEMLTPTSAIMGAGLGQVPLISSVCEVKRNCQSAAHLCDVLPACRQPQVSAGYHDRCKRPEFAPISDEYLIVRRTARC